MLELQWSSLIALGNKPIWIFDTHNEGFTHAQCTCRGVKDSFCAFFACGINLYDGIIEFYSSLNTTFVIHECCMCQFPQQMATRTTVLHVAKEFTADVIS